MTPEQNKAIEQETAFLCTCNAAMKYREEIERLKKELFTMEEIEAAWQDVFWRWNIKDKGLFFNYLKKQKEG